MLGHRHRYEVNLILEEIIELPDHVLPIAKRNIAKLADVELLEVVLHFEARREDGVEGNIFDGVVVAMLVLLVLFGVFHLEFEEDLEDLVAPRLGDISKMLAEFEDMAAVIDHLLCSLEIGIEVAFPAYHRPSVVVARVEEAGIAVVLTSLAIELNHIVLVADRMHVAVEAAN